MKPRTHPHRLAGLAILAILGVSVPRLGSGRHSLDAASHVKGATPFPTQRIGPGIHPISGRKFAGIMSYEGAAWLDREERDIEEEPERAINALGIKSGFVIADIGAGSGYMSIRLAKRVGPGGRVYATDIQPQMITLLQQRISKGQIKNIIPVLGTSTDSKLPEGELDLELLVDVYHEFSEPQRMLQSMRRGLKPTGQLVLLEYRKEDPNVPILEDHKMTIAEAKLEVEAEGFRLSRVDERLPRQHIIIFTSK